MMCDYNKEHYNVLKRRQNKQTKNTDTLKECISFHPGSTAANQREDGGSWTQNPMI